MKTLWNCAGRLGRTAGAKNRLFLCLLVLLTGLAGGILWLLAGRLLLPGAGYLLDFIACPAILFGFFGGIIYLYNHEFSDTPAPASTQESTGTAAAPASAFPEKLTARS